MGYVERRQGKMREAADKLTRALELDPRRSILAYNLGETYSLLRSFRLADENYDRALSIDPDYAQPYAFKVRCRFRLRNDIDGAKIVMKQARGAGVGSDARVLHQSILMEISAGNYPAALNLLDSARVELSSEQFWRIFPFAFEVKLLILKRVG